MPLVTLSLGSNIDPSFNIKKALCALKRRFEAVKLSPIYESESVGFNGPNFLNLAAAIEVDEPLGDLSVWLKALEESQGRDRNAPRFSARTLDIDILTYGSLCGTLAGITLPRPEITDHAFVLRPLADLLPDAVHPELGKTFRQLWSEFDQDSQHLWPVELEVYEN